MNNMIIKKTGPKVNIRS